jgi:tetratricopeptide (TPR) repeat protein
MASNRLEILKGMLAANPNDPFARYCLAMEYRNAGDPEAAVLEFRSLIAAHPDYAATYLHAGQTLERLGRIDEAHAVYRQGIEVTTRIGDRHACAELEAALG